MKRTRIPFTTLLIAVVLANFATLVVTYLLRVPVGWTVPIYLLCAVVGWLLARRVRWRCPAIKIDRVCVVLAVLTLIALTLPRLTYVSEWIPGNTVATIGDDYSRLFELISMTKSDAYPLRHSCNGNYLLSYYYAALYPFAVLKLLIPCMTLKDVLLVGYFFYHALILGSLVELAHLLMRNALSAQDSDVPGHVVWRTRLDGVGIRDDGLRMVAGADVSRRHAGHRLLYGGIDCHPSFPLFPYALARVRRVLL